MRGITDQHGGRRHESVELDAPPQVILLAFDELSILIVADAVGGLGAYLPDIALGLGNGVEVIATHYSTGHHLIVGLR